MDELACVLDDGDLKITDFYRPVIQVANSSRFASDRGTGVDRVRVPEPFALTTVEAL